MATQISVSTKAVGFWSAVLATVFGITYVVGQLAEWLGLLGSQGGPESASTPLGLAVLLTPSLLLGSSFLVLVVSIHQLALPERKIWSHAAVAFATIYALFAAKVFTGRGWIVSCGFLDPLRWFMGSTQGFASTSAAVAAV